MIHLLRPELPSCRSHDRPGSCTGPHRRCACSGCVNCPSPGRRVPRAAHLTCLNTVGKRRQAPRLSERWQGSQLRRDGPTTFPEAVLSASATAQPQDPAVMQLAGACVVFTGSSAAQNPACWPEYRREQGRRLGDINRRTPPICAEASSGSLHMTSCLTRECPRGIKLLPQWPPCSTPDTCKSIRVPGSILGRQTRLVGRLQLALGSATFR